MKNLLLILAFILTTSLAFSQVKIRPGVKAGLNFSDLNNFENSKTSTGMHAGLFVNVHLARFYELQLETGYSKQGAEIEQTFVNYDIDPYISARPHQYSLDYVSLGIANKFFPFKDIGVNFIVGPSIDILVSNYDYNYTTPIDLSFFGGVGYEFPFGLGLELRYKQGIIDVRDDYDYYNHGNDYYYRNLLNSVIQIGATYRFTF